MSLKQEKKVDIDTGENKESFTGPIKNPQTAKERRVANPQIAFFPRWFLANSFTPAWLPKFLRHPITGYFVAILLPIIAALTTILLVQLDPSFALPSLLEILAIALVVLNWGAGPGLVATIAGAAFLNFTILPSRIIWTFNGAKSIIGMLIFLLAGVTISIVASQIERVRRTTHDITTLYQSERETAARANELEAIFEAMTDGILVFNNAGQLLRMNAAARRLFALDAHPEDYSRLMHEPGNNFAPFDEHGQLLSEEQWPLYRMLKDETLASSNAIDITVHSPGGQDLQLSVSGAPMRDKEGSLIGAVCICRDVTERRQLEKRTQDTLNALLAMAEALVLVPESSTPGDHLTSGQLTSTTADEHASTGVSRVAQRLAELIRSVLGCQRVTITAIEPETKQLHSLAAIGLSDEQESQWRNRTPGFHLSDLLVDHSQASQLQANEAIIIDMTQRPFSDMPNPYNIHVMLITPMSVGDQLVGILSLDYGAVEHEYTSEEIALAKAVAKLAALVIERDRLLRERAESRANELALREANRRMDEFLGMTSHELRTPLTSIKGNTQLTVRQLKNSMQDIQKMQGMLESAERQTRLLDRLVNDLLDISRTQTNQLELNFVPCDLAVIVRETVEEQRQLWPARTITLDLLNESTVPVYADIDRISQVMSNYLTNALKYSNDDRPVHVTLHVEGEHTRVSVQDQGSGLSVDEQIHVWERFYRAQGSEVLSSSQSSTRGLGLGLYICKTLIEQHQGSVGVESTPGAGSTFWFTLPLETQDH